MISFYVAEKEIILGDAEGSDASVVPSPESSSDESQSGGEGVHATRKKKRKRSKKGKKRSHPSEVTSVELEITSRTQGK